MTYLKWQQHEKVSTLVKDLFYSVMGPIIAYNIYNRFQGVVEGEEGGW